MVGDRGPDNDGGTPEMSEAAVAKGLEGVVVAQSQLSYVDGQRGRLIYRGFDIRDLAEQGSFEEVAFLLWNGRLPTRGELEGLQRELARHRSLPPELVTMLRALPPRSGMLALQAAVAALGLWDPELEEMSAEANLRKAVRLTARVGSVVAAYHRLRRGLRPVEPHPELGHAANFLYMMSGELPDEVSRKALDVVLILHADHEFNASTFTGRVAASTLADIYAASSAAVGALKGPLHGGANEQVMRMLQEIGEPARAAAWVRQRLAARDRIPGFGHRVYKTWDPRALILKDYARRLGERRGDTRWYEITVEVERVVREEKGLYPNVDLYSASVYHALGIPLDLYTPVFAVSRIVGWTAHLLEQYADNRLIRPRAEYAGPWEATYVPLVERG